eukprot:SAG11_NODE_1178_length_5598_cov_4.168394_9_plen_56_part_00
MQSSRQLRDRTCQHTNNFLELGGLRVLAAAIAVAVEQASMANLVPLLADDPNNVK